MSQTNPEVRLESFCNDAASYLSGGDIQEDHLRGQLLDLGAEQPGSTLVIGRLRYVRGFMQSLEWLAGEGRPGDSWFA